MDCHSARMPSMSRLQWRRATTVVFNPGFELGNVNVAGSGELHDVSIACDGAFLHIQIPGGEEVQVVTAPNVQRIVYRADDD